MTTMKQAASAGVGEPCSRFKRDVLAGLSLQEKSLPSHYFYDAVGSDLFEQITVLPEYYPTRTEISILQGCAG